MPTAKRKPGPRYPRRLLDAPLVDHAYTAAQLAHLLAYARRLEAAVNAARPFARGDGDETARVRLADALAALDTGGMTAA